MPVLPGSASPALNAQHVLPDTAQLAALREVIQLGFYRGIMNKLAEIEKTQPDTAAFVEAMRLLARQFQFEAMARQLAPQDADHDKDADA